MKLVRVTLVDRNEQYEDWAKASVDLVVDDFGIVIPQETYGHWGRPYRKQQTESVNLWPFMVTMSKDDTTRIDFGQIEDENGDASYDDTVRFGTTNIGRVPVRVGEDVYIEYDEIRYPFKVARVTHIESGEVFNARRVHQPSG